MLTLEITEMLNGAIPAVAGVRCCWCNAWMQPRSAGEPCVVCLEKLRHQERLEEAACDYAATHGRGRDYILMQDGGID